MVLLSVEFEYVKPKIPQMKKKKKKRSRNGDGKVKTNKNQRRLFTKKKKEVLRTRRIVHSK